jgi:hypothetical protein
MLLSVRDLEMLSAIGHSVSVERIFHEYSHHLDHQPKDFTGSFTSVLNYHFGKHIELVKTPNYQQLFSQLDEIAKLVEALPKDGSNS